MKKLAFVIALLFALPAVFAADLSDYPAVFTDVSIVINDGNATDVQSAFMIANALQAADIDYQIRMASEIADTSGMQIISVGNNPVTTAIISANPAVANYTLQSGQARITMYENGSIAHVVVYGNSIADTQKGAYVLANYKNFALDYKDTIVTGTIPSLNLSRVMTHIDYSCGGNQSFGPDGSWPTPCIGAVLVPYFPLAPQPGTGGNGSNGSNGTGGNSTGGNSTGGNQTGGNQTGGNQTGGNQTGGNQTGGNQTGGNQTGGNSTNTTVTPGASLTLSNVLFGDDDQNRGENVTATATLTNTGTVALSGFGFSGLNSKYNLQVVGFPSTLASGQTATLTLTAFVPFDLDGVDNDCEENPVGIGTLSITTAQGATATDNAEMQAVNELAILDVFTVIAGQKERVLETKLVDIYQEDDLEVLVELKNRFSTDDDEPGQDQTIDVEVKVTGDTDEIDLDEDADVEIDADSEDSLTLEGTVDSGVKGNTKLILTAEGKDEKGALHCDQTLVKFNVIDGVRSAIRPATNTTPVKQPSFTPFPSTPKPQTSTTTKPSTATQPEPRQENVETIAPPVPVVSSGFRDSKVYVAWLVSLVLLMLSVIAAEAAFLIYKRKKASASLAFPSSEQQLN